MAARLKPLVALVLLVGIFMLVEPSKIVAVVVRLDPKTGGVVAVLGLVGIWVQFIKWRVLLRWRAPGLNGKQCLESLFVGFGLGCLSPGRLGELGRGLFLPGSSLAWVALSAIDRLGSTAVTVAAAAVGLVMVNPEIGIVALGALCGTFLWLHLFGRHRLSGVADRWQITRSVALIVGQIPGRLWMQNLSLSVAFNLLFFTQFWLLLSGFGELPTSSIWAVPSVFAVKALVPISVFDVGVREIAAMLVLGPVGVEPDRAFAAAFTLFLVNVLAPGLAGMMLILRRLKRAPAAANRSAAYGEA